MYVYVALYPDGTPAATTVRKYTMEIWLRKQSQEDRAQLSLWRCNEGSAGASDTYGKDKRTRVDLEYYDL